MRSIASSIVVITGALLVAFGTYMDRQLVDSGKLPIILGAIAMGGGMFFIYRERA